MPIPDLRDDGYLPEGVHRATLDEVEARFGCASVQRKKLMVRLRDLVALGQQVNARRILIDGSFVTSKINPGDVDVVIQVTQDYHDMFFRGLDPAVEIYELVSLTDPRELFSADDDEDWNKWIEFFQFSKESKQITKGLIEVIL